MNEYQKFNKDRYVKLRNAGFRCTCCGSSPEDEQVRLVICEGRVMCEQCKEGLVLSETEEEEPVPEEPNSIHPFITNDGQEI